MRDSVFITGASTGIGRAIALDLAENGFMVFATVRKESDATALSAANASIQALIADVTDDTSMNLAFEKVKAAHSPGRPLSLINNAGIAIGGPIESLSVDDWRQQFEVNLFGVVRTTKLLLPLIRETKGSIINMSSVSGLMATPFMGPYAASKFALEAFSDALRCEVASFGVRVTLIEPGPIKTPIWDKGLAFKLPESARLPIYEKAMARFTKLIEAEASRALPVERVSSLVRRILNDPSPPARTVVTKASSAFALRLARALPSKIVDKMIVREIFGK